MANSPNASVPKHIAVIMDGNGRWAKKRFLPRVAGHKAGVETVRKLVKLCAENNVAVLTLFAFSSENWRRPEQEVSFLMDLFIKSLEKESTKLHEQNVQVRVIGDRSRFHEKLQQQIFNSEELTKHNTGLKLVIAANYGGHWDICQAVQQIANDVQQNKITAHEVSQELIQSKLATADLPDPDLLIRTSGETRISNFMLWQTAYSELYFTDVLWPDFDEKEFAKALDFFANRERRFGYISEQLRVESDA